jgi:sec-independent protein translocase protein TatA
VPFGVSVWEILILLLVVLLVFGPKRLPEMGRSLGKGMREFKDSISGKDDEPVELPPPQEEAPVPAGRSRDKTTTP